MGLLGKISEVVGILVGLITIITFILTNIPKYVKVNKNKAWFKWAKIISFVLLIIAAAIGFLLILLMMNGRLEFHKMVQNEEINSWIWWDIDEGVENNMKFNWIINSSSAYKTQVYMFLVPYSKTVRVYPLVYGYETEEDIKSGEEKTIVGRINYSNLNEAERYRICGLLVDKKDSNDIHIKCSDATRSLPPR